MKSKFTWRKVSFANLIARTARSGALGPGAPSIPNASYSVNWLEHCMHNRLKQTFKQDVSFKSERNYFRDAELPEGQMPLLHGSSSLRSSSPQPPHSSGDLPSKRVKRRVEIETEYLDKRNLDSSILIRRRKKLNIPTMASSRLLSILSGWLFSGFD